MPLFHVPTAPTLIKASAVQVSRNSANVAGDATDQALVTFTVPGGAMGANGFIVVNHTWTVNNSSNTKRIKVKLAGVTYFNATYTTTLSIGNLRTVIHNRNSETSQTGSTASNLTSSVGPSSGTITTAPSNTTVDMSLQLFGAWTTSVASETISLERYECFVVRVP